MQDCGPGSALLLHEDTEATPGASAVILTDLAASQVAHTRTHEYTYTGNMCTEGGMREIFLFGVCTPYCLLTVFVVCAASASRTFTVFAYQSFGTV